jgi:2-keto-3-deoxy-L-rhamnonate aldolase RhmA
LENHTNSKKIDSKKNPLLRVGKIAMKKKVMLDITAVKVILIMISTKESVKKLITFLDKKQKY